MQKLSLIRRNSFLVLFSVLLVIGCSISLQGQTTINCSVAIENDDAEEEGPTGDNPGAVYLNSSDLEMVRDDGSSQGTQIVGIRFTNITVPVGATITNAYMTFTADDAEASNPSNSSSVTLTIKGHDIDSTTTFTTANSNISSRTTTTASTSWTPGSWTTGSTYNTSSLASVVQEIVDRGGWSSGNPMAFIVTGPAAGGRTAESFNAGFPPELTITYTVSTLNLSTSVTHESCIGVSDGAIDLIVTDDTPPTTFAWSDGPTTEDRTGLSPGNYTVTVTDATGSQSTSATVNVGTGPTLSFSVTQESTPGAGDGAIDLTLSGIVTPPVSFAWSNGETTEDITSLSEGTYTVTVTDACPSTTITSRTIRDEVTKQLYLSTDGSGSPDQDLDRVDPVATMDNTTSISSSLEYVNPVNEGMTIWSGTGTPEYNTWDGSSFGSSSGTGVDNGNRWRIMQGAAAPTRNEKIVIGVENSSSTVSGQFWNGSSWSAISIGGSTDFGAPGASFFWGLEVAYESQSGDALVVYGDGSALNYSIWNGTSWSTETTITSCTSGTPYQLRLASNPNSDEMVLVVNHSNETDCALVWDGSIWGNSVTLDNSTSQDRSDIFVAYEQQSGEAMVIYEDNTDVDARYRTWNGSSWSTESTITAPSGPSGYARWTHLASDPNSDQIAIGVLTTNSDVWFAIWNGSSWGSTNSATTGANGNTELNVSVAFESESGEAIGIYGEGANTQYKTWNGSTWSGELTAPSIGGTSNSMELYSDPLSDKVMLVVNDDNSDINCVPWSGTSWGSVTEVETSSGETKNQPFVFIFDQSTLSGDTNTTFTQATAMCSDFDIDNGSTVTADLYLDVTLGTVTGSSDITGLLRYGATTIANLTNAGYSAGILTLSGTLGSAVTVPTGQSVELEITNNESGLAFTIEYDSQTKPSKIEFPTTTYINITSYAVYDAPYPGGSIITSGVPGDIVYLRAMVSDPFGFNDITGLNIDIGGTPTAATSVATSGCTRTYEYVWNTTGQSGTVPVPATAEEGYEGTVTDTDPLNFALCSPVIGDPVFALGTSSTRCQGAGSATYTVTSTNSTGISYSLDAASLTAGNSINSSTGEVTYTAGWIGTSTITVTSTGCGGPLTETHGATTNGTITTPVFVLGATSTRCQAAETATYTATSDYTAGITYTLDATSLAGGNTINASTGAVMYDAGWSGTSTITASAAGCVGPLTATHTVTTNGTVTTPVFTSGATSTRCQGAGSVTYTATSINETSLTYSLDAASVTGGNSINTSTGEVTFVSGWSGTSIITVNATGCGGPMTADHTVTVTPTVGTPVFTLGATSSRCLGAGTVTYSATATNTTGITYSLDGTSSGAGNTINTNTGAVTYTATWTGTSVITASAAGCNGPSTATHTVTTNVITAVDDSGTGVQGEPLIINVLDNDECDIDATSLTILSQPTNGSLQVGTGGSITYLPNGSYSGIDQYTYRVCSNVFPAICDDAVVNLTITGSSNDPCTDANQSKIFYLPFPENATHVRAALKSAGSTSNHGNSVQAVTSFTATYPGTIVTYDHWEDDYETDITSPIQSSTLIWGDGNTSNGTAPGYPSDIIPSGGYIILDNTFTYNPRNSATIMYDGKDKMYTSNDISVSKYVGDAGEINVQSFKSNVVDITRFGKLFVAPFGEDITLGSTPAFKYTGMFIRAATDGTIVNLDYDGNGVVDVTQSLDEGEVWLYDGTASTIGDDPADVNNANDIQAGATITSNFDVGVDMLFGDIRGYGTRNFPLLPGAFYSSSYMTPVYTSAASNVPVYVFLTNTLSTSITVNWTSASSSGSIVVPANGTNYHNLPAGVASGYKYESVGGESFSAISIIDGDDPGLSYDWAFNLTPTERLTNFSTIAWAPGSEDLTQNYNPIWVTPDMATTLYIKYDGDLTSMTGPFSPINGIPYDVSVSLTTLQGYRILDNSDNDQTGTALFTENGAVFAAAWGQDAKNYSGSGTIPTGGSAVSQDVGYTLSPRCLDELILANDDTETTFPSTPVIVSVLDNDAGFLTTLDSSTVIITLFSPPFTGTTVVNVDGTITYTPAPGFTGIEVFEYRVCNSGSTKCDIATVTITVSCVATTGQNIIAGLVYEDANANGVFDAGDIRTPDVSVNIYKDIVNIGIVDGGDTSDGTAVTDANGNYTYTVTLGTGNYVMEVDVTDPDLPSGATMNPDNVETTTFTATGQTDCEKNFGFLNTADVSIAKTPNMDSVTVGEDVTFTITVSNAGPAPAIGVLVSDVLPAGLSYVSDNGSGAYVSGTGVWTVPTITSSGSQSLSITATVTTVGLKTNTATITATGLNDPTTNDHEDTADVTGVLPDISINKIVDNATPNVGDQIIFTITADNIGLGNATGLQVTDVLPSEFTYVSDDAGGSYVPGTGVWTIGDLDASSTATLNITVTANTVSTPTNTASVTALDQTDSDTGNDSASVMVTIDCTVIKAPMTITKN